MATQRDPIQGLISILTGAMANYEPPFRFIDYYPSGPKEWEKQPENVGVLLVSGGEMAGHAGGGTYIGQDSEGQNQYYSDEARHSFQLLLYHSDKIQQFALINRLNGIFHGGGTKSINIDKAVWQLGPWAQGSTFETLRKGERLLTWVLTLSAPFIVKDSKPLVKGHSVSGEVGEKVKAIANLGFARE